MHTPTFIAASFINSQHMETTSVSANRGMDTDVVCTYTTEYYSVM